MVSKRLSREVGHRRKFLAIIDDTPECERAVAYASKRAQSTSGVPVSYTHLTLPTNREV